MGKRMIKLGNARYKQHLKRDRELKALIAKNKAETDARMQAMANGFNGQLNKVRKQMKKNRKHAERMLAKKTQGLYKAIAKQDALQKKMHGKLAEANRRAVLDVMDAVR